MLSPGDMLLTHGSIVVACGIAALQVGAPGWYDRAHLLQSPHDDASLQRLGCGARFGTLGRYDIAASTVRTLWRSQR